MLKEIKKTLEEYSLNVSSEKILKLNDFISEIIDKNKKVNLISKNDEINIIDRHLIDCLMITKTGLIENQKELIDIGSGGGFPGIVTAIIYDNLTVTLSEQKQRKYYFLVYIKEKLKLNNIKILNKHINKNHTEKYDIVTQRAAGKFDDIYPVSIELLKSGGLFISWLSYCDTQKLKLKTVPHFIYNYKLKDGKERSIFAIKK